MGMGLDVKKSTVEEVKARIDYHIERKHRQLEGTGESETKALEEYNFDEQVEKLREEEEKIRQRYRVALLKR